MGNLLRACHDADLIYRSDLGAQATVNTEELAVNDGGQHQKVKDVAAGLPDGGVAVLLLTLFVETIYLCDLS